MKQQNQKDGSSNTVQRGEWSDGQGAHTWVEPLYFFSLQLHLSCLLSMPTPIQSGPFWAIYDHVSNVLSNDFNPKMNYFSTHEQTSPLNHPLPRLPKAEISQDHIPAPTGDWTLPLRRQKLFSYRHLTLRNILEPKESKCFQTSPCQVPLPSPWMAAIVDSCKASELPRPWLGPCPFRLQQETPTQQCHPSPILCGMRSGTGVFVFRLQDSYIQISVIIGLGLVSGGEERISGPVWVLKSICQNLLSHLLSWQHTLLCINSLVVIFYSWMYRCDIWC